MRCNDAKLYIMQLGWTRDPQLFNFSGQILGDKQLHGFVFMEYGATVWDQYQAYNYRSIDSPILLMAHNSNIIIKSK